LRLSPCGSRGTAPRRAPAAPPSSSLVLIASSPRGSLASGTRGTFFAALSLRLSWHGTATRTRRSPFLLPRPHRIVTARLPRAGHSGHLPCGSLLAALVARHRGAHLPLPLPPPSSSSHRRRAAPSHRALGAFLLFSSQHSTTALSAPPPPPTFLHASGFRSWHRGCAAHSLWASLGAPTFRLLARHGTATKPPPAPSHLGSSADA